MTTITTTQTTQPSGPAHGTMRAALAYPHFRRLLGALAVSQAGDWLYNLALLALVFSRTHSPAWLSVTTAARVLPVVVLGPIGGVLADRYNRKRLMVSSDILRVGFMLALAAVAALGLPVLLAPMLAAATTAVGSVYPSCVAAATPGLVPDADLPGANALRSAVNATCVIVGPGLGAALLLVGSPAIAIAINAVTFAVSAGLVAAYADQTDRHQSSIARSRAGPAGAATTSATVIAPRCSGSENVGHVRVRPLNRVCTRCTSRPVKPRSSCRYSPMSANASWMGGSPASAHCAPWASMTY